MIQNILIVDPILRGSRLVNTSHTIAGFRQRGWKAHLLTRREAITEHYREMLAGSDHQLHATLPVPSETWFEKLSPETIRSCMAEIERLTAQHPITALFFTGWNEFFPVLPIQIWRQTEALNHLPTLAIDYSPGCWLPPENKISQRDRLKSLGKRMMTRLALKRFGTLRLLLLDERVLQINGSSLPAQLRRRFARIPDPAPLPKAVPHPAPSPASLPTMLVVGLQTARKGLIDVIKLLEQNPQDLPLSFHLVGRLAADTEALRPRLLALPRRHFIWSEGFWPEQTIQRYYAAADYVLLPYARSFDSSSAVLAMACGHGKPVVTTDHGVIGFRVRQQNLGLAYPSRDLSALTKVLRQLPPPSSPEYLAWSANCRQFAGANSVEKYQEAVCNLISNET